MAASNRQGAPGRTPPFILVGLLVLVCFLAYNYWSISSQNSELMAQLEITGRQARDLSEQQKGMKGNLDVIKNELNEAKKQVEAQKGVISSKDGEIEKQRKEAETKKAEAESCQKSLETCSTNLKTEQEEKKKLKDNLDVVQKELDAQKQTASTTCDKASCEGPLKEALAVIAKVTGLQPIVKPLTDAGFDAQKLLASSTPEEKQAAPASVQPQVQQQA